MATTDALFHFHRGITKWAEQRALSQLDRRQRQAPQLTHPAPPPLVPFFVLHGAPVPTMIVAVADDPLTVEIVRRTGEAQAVLRKQGTLIVTRRKAEEMVARIASDVFATQHVNMTAPRTQPLATVELHVHSDRFDRTGTLMRIAGVTTPQYEALIETITDPEDGSLLLSDGWGHIGHDAARITIAAVAESDSMRFRADQLDAHVASIDDLLRWTQPPQDGPGETLPF